MSYYFATSVEMGIGDAVRETTEALSRNGFGVLTDIDVQATMKRKLDRDIPGYRILGACNPDMAFKALETENKIGTMLPCNVIVRDEGNGRIEIAAVDPVASMQSVDNPELVSIAAEVRKLLETTISEIGSLSG